MAFEIVVVADVGYKTGNETFVISKRSISQNERTLVSRPAFKEDVTTYSVMFKADTTHGTFEWEVEYTVSPDGLGIEPGFVVTSPAGVSEVEDLQVEFVEHDDDDVFDDVEEL